MVSYKEQKENKRVFVLLKNGSVVGVFGNLKKLCESVKDDAFPSYWTLARKKEYRMETGVYVIEKTRIY